MSATLSANLPADLLAAIYIQPVKLAAVALIFAIWARFTEWVDKDAVAVNTFHVLWNLVFLGVGATALALALLLPNFLIGYLICVLLNLIAMTAYVVHRNGLVRPEDTVFTAAHLKRIQEQGFSGKGKKKQKEVTERVSLRGPSGALRVPEDDEQREHYRITQELFFDVLLRRATLVELIPAGEVTKLVYQIDGINSEREPLPRAQGDAVLGYIKKSLGLNLEERRKPQNGEFQAKLGDQSFRIQIRTDGSTAGEKLRLRVVGDEERFKVTDLGFTEKQLALIQDLTHNSLSGVVLLSGPRGSGLTTTIYSFTRSHDAFLQNIQLLEYTSELEIDNVTQKRYRQDEGKSFTDELLKIIRSDPDIVVLPELREQTSAPVIAKAAADKQKIYVGLGANDAVDAIRRWIKLVGDPKSVAQSLLAVTDQRLVRKLCNQCKEAYKPDPQMMRKLNLPADAVLHRVPEPQYDKHGNPILCPACQGAGYVGRTGVFDLIVVDAELKQVIARGGEREEIRKYLIKRGGGGLQKQALEKVLSGVTSIQEVVRVTRSPAAGGGAGAAA